jgi:hypothetical protein
VRLVGGGAVADAQHGRAPRAALRLRQDGRDLRVVEQFRRQPLGEAPDERAQAVLAFAPLQDPARLSTEGEVGRA